MTATVKALIELLQAFPPEAVISITNVEEDQEFEIFSIDRGDNDLTIDFVIEEKEKEEED